MDHTERTSHPPNDSAPAAIVDPVMACLRYEPAERPTAAEIAAELEPVLEALPRPKIARLKPRLR